MMKKEMKNGTKFFASLFLRELYEPFIVIL